jgi:hypothetical protein
VHGAQQRLDVQHADDVVRIVLPQRQACVGTRQHLVDELAGRLVGVDRGHVLAVDHDLLDLHLGEVQDRSQHLARVAFLLAFAGVQFDRAAQFLLALARRQGGGQTHPEERQGEAHHRLHGQRDRPQQPDHDAHAP